MKEREQLGAHMMLAFDGTAVPPRIAQWLAERPCAGVTLFKAHNVASLAQVRVLTDHLQRIVAERGDPPLLIAADQEGGQLLALGADVTQFAGNMALGATRDAELARRVGLAMGREMRAVGINLNYAPDCDMSTNPNNPSCGARAFADDAELASQLAAAFVAGQQAAGVAATVKHFPGKGEAAVDSHYEMPLIGQSREEMMARELRPFTAALDAGAKLVMTGHFAIPALTGRDDLPATLSRAVMYDFLRGELGFEGVIITDAIDMGALTQGAGQIIDMLAAIRAEVDLLLTTVQPEVQERIYQGLLLAQSRGLFDERRRARSLARVAALRRWTEPFEQPDLSVIHCAEHRTLAAELAQKSMTLVRNEVGLLPLQLTADQRMLAIMPQPQNLTPADTSADVEPRLAATLRAHHGRVDEIVVSHSPTDEEIRATAAQAHTADVIVVGTIAASMNRAQTELVRHLLTLGKPTVTVALRTPYDLAVYPKADTHLCAYSILPPSLDALAAALFGKTAISGKLPVTVAGVAEFGHGLSC